MTRSKRLNIDDVNNIMVEEDVEEKPTRSGRLADSLQPKDIFQQLDSTVRDMSERFNKEPYTAAAYQSAIQTIPGIDPLTKSKLSQGDTTNLKEVYGIPALHFINQYLFNYPRSVAASMGYEFPEAETLPGKVLSKGAGVAGALKQFQTGVGVAKKIVPEVATTGLAKTGIKHGINTTLRGAVAGGVQGAIMSPEDPLDFKSRGQQVVVGTVLGGLLAPVSSKITNFIKKKKLRGITTLKSRVSGKRANVDLKNTLDDIESGKVIKEANSLLEQSQKELQDAVAIQQVRGKVPQLKAASLQHGKQVNRVYDHTVNRISREIEENTTSHGAVEHFKGFLDELGADEGLKNTSAFGRVSKFVSNIIDDGDNLTFKKVNDMRHGIVKGKIYKGDMDDVVYTQFRKAFNDWAETVDTTGKFKTLNKGMAPRLDFKAALNKKLNIFKKYETGKAEKLVEKYANRDVNPKGITQGEIDLMDDAMKYFNKYGVKTSDIETIYKGRVKDLAKVQSVSNKLSDIIESGKTSRSIKSANLKNIRIKQSGKIGDIDIAKSKRLVINAINTVIRLSLAGAALNAFHEFKKGTGLSSDIPAGAISNQ